MPTLDHGRIDALALPGPTHRTIAGSPASHPSIPAASRSSRAGVPGMTPAPVEAPARQKIDLSRDRARGPRRRSAPALPGYPPERHNRGPADRACVGGGKGVGE